jgi:hypothetical protein
MMIDKVDRRLKNRIDPLQHRFDRTHRCSQISVYASDKRIMASSRRKHIEMMPHRIRQSCECAVVKESRLQRHVR